MKKLTSVLLFLFTINLLQPQELQIPAFGTDSTLEVMSWNIEWFPKNGQTTVDLVNEIVRDLDVDILALQEIDDKSYFDQLLENLNGWEGYYVDSEYSNLAYIYKSSDIEMVSFYEIYTTEEYWRPLPRAPMVFEFIYLSEKYFVINNHLKCCGDGYMDVNDPWDEETRRRDACILLDDYISTELQNEKVILLGDLNDILTDSPANNVFNVFIDNEEEYQFVDMDIAEGSTYGWSYPSWPSHIDHICITDELYDDFSNYGSEILTLRLDDFFDGGFNEYDYNVSDHRPVALKIKTDFSVGTDNHQQPNLVLYPNPCGDKLLIKGLSNQYSKILISDITGKKLIETILQPGENSVSVDFLVNGIYFLSTNNNNGFNSFMFVKADDL